MYRENSDSENAETRCNRMKLLNYANRGSHARYYKFITMRIHYRLILYIVEMSSDVKVAFSIGSYTFL